MGVGGRNPAPHILSLDKDVTAGRKKFKFTKDKKMEVIFHLDADGDKRRLALMNVSEDMFIALWEIIEYLRDCDKYDRNHSIETMRKTIYSILEAEGVDLDKLNSIEDVSYEDSKSRGLL